MGDNINVSVNTASQKMQGCLTTIFMGLFKIVNGLFMLIPGFRKLPPASQDAISGLTIVAVVAAFVALQPKTEHQRREPAPKTPVQEIESAISDFKNPDLLGSWSEKLGIESAIQSLETAANAGVVAAMPVLADIYRNGKFGQTKNTVKAAKWDARYKELSAPGAQGAIVISDEMAEELKQTILAYEQKKAQKEAEAARKKAEEEAEKKANEAAKGLGGLLLDAAAGAVKEEAKRAINEAARKVENSGLGN